ncbi:MAG: ureidoglycolate lyase [Melioribacteraceae bacterium]|nr:ureidoglycolate lyase [Melioribacteraceae bacterium]MCF8355475.1 ureidoglycolate lyase [Melioribacteraceae bacterium]MCF8392548.1 ureidoglycolate lyase [Melioribacteraceae bacterium]MCF8418437.1 ureidoglycolate lyase [Melioribacteraceae bacterium]
MITINTKQITEDNFKKFGRVVKSPKGEPTAQANDFKFWSDITDYEIDGTTEIGICTVYKQPKNIINGMERHLLTPEILIPIDAPFVLPLLKEGDSGENAEAFQVDIGEVVIIDNSVWHGACLPVEKIEASYFVIFKKGTPQDDVYKKQIEEFEIHFEI